MRDVVPKRERGGARAGAEVELGDLLVCPPIGGLMTMEVLTLYAGQGNFAVVRHGGQAIAVDTRRPAELSDDMASKVDRFLRRRELVGIVLTGFDDDHADPDGLDWLLDAYASGLGDVSKYYKETENARRVFKCDPQA